MPRSPLIRRSAGTGSQGALLAGFGTMAAWGISLILISGALPAGAQGTLTVLQTGGGQPLVSDQQVLQLNGIVQPLILFDFGFVTDQTPAPGVFLDSFTVSFEDAASNVAVVATADASGVAWAPTSPGAVPLTDAQIQRQTILPPSQSPVLGQGVAYAVQVPVPSAFMGSSLTVYFDLFDNLDPTTRALGWFQNLQVVPVPEPPAGLLMGLGVVLMAIKRRFGR